MPRSRRLVTGAVGALAAAGALFLAGSSLWGGSAVEGISTHTVAAGAFRISHFESGEVWAARNERISSPRVGGRLTIVHMWPEGERVEVGDLILQFDRSEFENELKERTERLEQTTVDLESARADQKQKVAELEMQIEQREAEVELARINLRKAAYGSPVEQERRLIRLKQAERHLHQTEEALEARYLINEAQTANLVLSIAQARKQYDKAQKDYERLTVYADRPGILVHEKMEKPGPGNRREKIKEGDTVWGGVAILTAPDLNAMQVVSQVGEMDIHMIRVGLDALIELEAFPGPVFHGVVANVAPMAVTDEDADNVQIFEMIVDIEEQDSRLYPGMSAAVEIIVETLDNVLTVPLPAVHRDANGEPYVYRLQSRSFEPCEVAVGKRNATAIVVESGLQAGDVVALGTPELI